MEPFSHKPTVAPQILHVIDSVCIPFLSVTRGKKDLKKCFLHFWGRLYLFIFFLSNKEYSNQMTPLEVLFTAEWQKWNLKMVVDISIFSILSTIESWNFIQ